MRDADAAQIRVQPLRKSGPAAIGKSSEDQKQGSEEFHGWIVAASLVDKHGQRFQQRRKAVPDNLNANADQQKRGKAHDDAHGSGAENFREAVGKGVADVNAR